MSAWMARIAAETDAWRRAMSGIASNPFRTGTVLIACSWGITFLVLLNYLSHEMDRANLQLVSQAGEGERIMILRADVNESLAQSLDRMRIPGVSLCPWVKVEREGWSQQACGMGRGLFALESVRLVSGRPMDLGDILTASRCCWINTKLAEKLEREGASDGLVLHDASLEVAGVYAFERTPHPFTSKFMDPFKGDEVFVPITTVTEFLPRELNSLHLMVKVTDPAVLLAAYEDVLFGLEELGLDVSGAEDSRGRLWDPNIATMQKDRLRIFMILESIVLAFSWAGAVNLMLAQRRQRVREMGVLKSLGASSRDVFRQLLRESLLVGALAGLFGGLLGSGAACLIGYLVQWDVDLQLKSFQLGFMVSVAAALVIGLVPAWLGSRMDAVRALRHE